MAVGNSVLWLDKVGSAMMLELMLVQGWAMMSGPTWLLMWVTECCVGDVGADVGKVVKDMGDEVGSDVGAKWVMRSGPTWVLKRAMKLEHRCAATAPVAGELRC
jgi:hypothetical protein